MIKKYFFLMSLLLYINHIYALPPIHKYDPGYFVTDEVPFYDEKGKKHFLYEYEGQPMLLTFWASWCSNCVEELPSLDVLAKDFRKLPIKFITISEDYKGIDAVKKFWADYEIRNLEIFHDANNQLFQKMEISGIPTSIFIDKNGEMKFTILGTVNWNDPKIRGVLLSYIDGSYPMPRNSFKSNNLRVIKAP